MGKLLCEKNLRDVWCRNESVRAEIGQILHTHTHTHAAKLVVEMASIHRSWQQCNNQNLPALLLMTSDITRYRTWSSVKYMFTISDTEKNRSL